MATSTQLTGSLQGKQFPQADDLEKVYLTVRAIAAGHTDDAGIEAAIGLSSGDRQGRYYRSSGVALGLLVNSANHAHLTTAGLELAAAASGEEKRKLLTRAVVGLQPLALLLAYMSEATRQRRELRDYFRGIYPGATTTADRRLSTALSYFQLLGLAKETGQGWQVTTPTTVVDSEVQEPTESETSPSAHQSAPAQNLDFPSTFGDPKMAQIDVDLQKHDRANAIHKWLVSKVQSKLAEAGIPSVMTPHIDLMAAHAGSNIIYEMKSISQDSENMLAQIRKAVSQLHEYRFIYDLDAVLCIVTNQPIPPALAWLSKYLGVDRGIAYVWVNEEEGTFSSDVHSDGLLEHWM